MEKLIFNAILLQTTRRCNLNCIHCYCGKAQDVDMSKETVDKFLDQTESINRIFLSGGEPLMNIPILEYIVDQLIKRKIKVGTSGLITNGSIYDDRIVELMKKLESFRTTKDKPVFISVSTDSYHDNISETMKQNMNLYKEKLKDTKVRFKENSNADKQIVYSGNAVNSQIDNDNVKYLNTFEKISLDGNIVNSVLTLNVHGKYRLSSTTGEFSYDIEEFNNNELSCGNVDHSNILTIFNKYNKRPEIVMYDELLYAIRNFVFIDDFEEFRNGYSYIKYRLNILNNICCNQNRVHKFSHENISALTKAFYGIAKGETDRSFVQGVVAAQIKKKQEEKKENLYEYIIEMIDGLKEDGRIDPDVAQNAISQLKKIET